MPSLKEAFKTELDSLSRGWSSSPPEPDLSAVLASLPPDSDEIIAELLAVDARERWSRGLPATLEVYQRMVPNAVAPGKPSTRVVLLAELTHCEDRYRPDLRERLYRLYGPAFEGDIDAALEQLAAKLQAGIETVLADSDNARAASSNQSTADFDHVNTVDAASVQSPGLPVIDGYEILAKLGQGGMGAVYRAVQLATKREVALKVMAGATLGSEKSRRRFEREVELAASLEHPHIARVFDSGLHRGVYFYAMQLVPGKELDKYLKPRKFSDREVLELFAKVCRAVEFAHRKGVIHRDLKPSNVMVTDEGEPFVLDFGLAKTLLEEDAPRTISQEGDAAGTPAYMSPEQAAGKVREIDTRSDVYTLGVILFRLLTGTPPHDLSGSHYEIRRRIIEDDPNRPRAARPDIDRDLEAILLKCLERQPADRYGSAGGLAEDIERYLQGDTVSAQTITASYFFRKKLAKHKTLVTLAAVLFLLANAAVVFYIVQIKAEQGRTEAAKIDSDRNAANAEIRRADAETQRNLAQRRFNDVRRIANTLVFELYDSIEHLSGATLARRLLIATGLQYLDALAAEADDPALRRELARGYQRMGDVQAGFAQQNLGDHAGALLSYEKAQAILAELERDAPGNVQVQRDMSVSHNQLGDLWLQLSQTDRALAHYEASLAIRQRLAEADPTSAQAQRDLSVNYEMLGEVQLKLGRSGDALTSFEMCQKIAGRLAGAFPDSLQCQRDVAVSHEKVGNVRRQLGQVKEALANYEAMHGAMVRLAEADPTSAQIKRDLSISHGRIADVQVHFGRAHEALENFKKMRAILEQLAGDDPLSVQAQRDLWSSDTSLGKAQLQLGKPGDALATFERGHAIAQRLAEADPANVAAQRDRAVSHENLGKAQRQLGRIEAALAQDEAALSVLQRLVETDPVDAALQRDASVCRIRIGDWQLHLGLTDQAMETYEAARAVLQRLAAAEPASTQAQLDLMVALERVGDLQLRLGRATEALTTYEAQLAATRRVVQADPDSESGQRSLALSLNRLGDAQLRLGRNDVALVSYAASLEIRQRLGKSNPANAQTQRELALGHDRLGDVLLGIGRADGALANYETSMVIKQRLAEAAPTGAQTQRDLSISMNKIGDAQLKLGESGKALVNYENALTIRQRLAETDLANGHAQRDLLVSYLKVGAVYSTTAGEIARSIDERIERWRQAKAVYGRGRGITEAMRRRGTAASPETPTTEVFAARIDACEAAIKALMMDN